MRWQKGLNLGFWPQSTNNHQDHLRFTNVFSSSSSKDTELRKNLSDTFIHGQTSLTNSLELMTKEEHSCFGSRGVDPLHYTIRTILLIRKSSLWSEARFQTTLNWEASLESFDPVTRTRKNPRVKTSFPKIAWGCHHGELACSHELSSPGEVVYLSQGETIFTIWADKESTNFSLRVTKLSMEIFEHQTTRQSIKVEWSQWTIELE